MKKKNKLLISTFTAVFLISQALLAEEALCENNISNLNSHDIVYIPYAFSTDSTGFSAGVGVIKQGFLQPHVTAIATLFYGAEQNIVTNGQDDTANFSGGLLAIFDYVVPGTERLLFSAIGMKTYFPKARTYIYNHTNNSNEDAYVESSGDSDFAFINFRYVLPMGDGLDNPEGDYTLENGFVVGREGYGGGKPFVTGRTGLGIAGFYGHNTFDNYLPPTTGVDHSSKGLESWNTNGLRFFVDHDNTDYDFNPSRGYQFKLQYSKDFAWGDSKQSWDFLEFKYNHYVNLPTFSFTQQNVLAMSFWTGYSFSWERGNPQNINSHQPPPWEGGRLGGMFRMRGYNTNRFSDKAVIYGTAEYRAILDWNPFRKNDYIPIAVDWLQVVGFVEAGRVHDTYNPDLLNDMKFDAGVSLRAMVAQVPVRLDVAYGDEGVNFWVMIFQPFDF